MYSVHLGMIRSSEALEAELWFDLMQCAPAPVAEAIGLVSAHSSYCVQVAAPNLPSNEFNRAIGLGSFEPINTECIRDVLAFFRARGQVAAWIQLPDVDELRGIELLLQELGAMPPTTYWQFFQADPAQIIAATDPSGLEVVPITQANGREAAEVFCTGYGLPSSFHPWIEAIIGRPRWHSFGVRAYNRIISVGFLWVNKGRGALAGTATLPAFRQIGAQTHLIRKRAEFAANLGLSTLQCHTWIPQHGEENPSFGNLIKCGFLATYKRGNWIVGLP